MILSFRTLQLRSLPSHLSFIAERLVDPNEFFMAALEEAKSLMDQDGEDLRKQALACLLAADIQHRSNAHAWLMMILKQQESTATEEERYDAALQFSIVQRDQGQISFLINSLIEMDFDVATDEKLLEASYELVKEELRQELNSFSGKDWSVIDRLNRLMDD